jgi:hypothetical protein
MAISRMNMERQLRNMGGLMTLEEPRQGYFLGKIVRKAKKAVKKVVKSPIGKAAILGAGLYGLGGAKFLGGQGIFAGGQGLSRFSNLLSPFQATGKLSTLGDLFRVGGKAGADFSVPRILGGLAGAGAIAAPFLMGGDEEEEDPGVPFGDPIASVEAIRDRARQYYTDPTNSALYFMPPKSAVQSRFYAAGGGLADIPREGYKIGGSAFGLPGLAIKGGQKIGEMVKAGVGKVKSLFDDADINISVRDEDVLTDSGLQAQATGLDVSITPKSNKAVQVMDGLIEEGYDIAKAEDGSYAISSLDEGALNLIAKRLRLGGKDIDEFTGNFDDMYSGSDEKMIADALRDRKAEGGIMDLGGMEKDYREGGFVPIGAKERADDVPARLSKNEFVFTADAVRNAGGGDIDKGAEVMQNMMDNLEAGGMISEESQGKENPAQAMFDQAQMLESRIV